MRVLLRLRWRSPLLCSAARRAMAAEKHELLGLPAPDLVARGLTGQNVRLSEHRGEVVVVSFWSGACNTCRAQLEALDRIAKTYGSAGLTVIGVNLDDNAAARREIRARAGCGISSCWWPPPRAPGATSASTDCP